MTKDWKTTSAGILMILGGLIGIYFSVKSGTISEAGLLAAATSIVGGIGLLFAKDATV